MSAARSLRPLVASLLAAALAVAPAQGQTLINFDELTGVGDQPLPANYRGINWNDPRGVFGFGWISENYPLNLNINCRSGLNCAFNSGGAAAAFSSRTPFTISGWYGRWSYLGGATVVDIEAFRDGVTTSVWSSPVGPTDTYQPFVIDTPVNTVLFRPRGGGGVTCSGQNCGYFFLDDLTVAPATVVPEPGTGAMVAMGALLLGWARARRRG
jgi:hypothetical protein